jgi:transcriptional regulator with XRE-family HTH domain
MEELRRLRKQRGMTQAKLAVLADLDPSSLSQIETGARHPTTRTLEKLAGVLGVEVRDLFPLGQAPLPLERTLELEALALEASDEEFEEMVREADEARLGAMKRELSGHLPGGGPNPPPPTNEQLLAVRRCISIYRRQRELAAEGEELHRKRKERAANEEERLQELLAARTA